MTVVASVSFVPTKLSVLPPLIEHVPVHVTVALVTTEHVGSAHVVQVASPALLKVPLSHATHVPELSAPTLEPAVFAGHATHSSFDLRPLLSPYRPTLHRPGQSPPDVKPRRFENVPFAHRPSHCASVCKSAPCFVDHFPSEQPWHTRSEIGYEPFGQLLASARCTSVSWLPPTPLPPLKPSPPSMYIHDGAISTAIWFARALGLSPDVSGVDQTSSVLEVPPFVSRMKKTFVGVKVS
jgi:hypothetical protein